MAELRQDPIVGRWTIVAEERAARPNEFARLNELTRPASARAGGACPFCQGQEDQTPAETWALRSAGSAPNGPGWRVRVVPNKYPALDAAGGQVPPPDDLLRARPARGVHEVIVESPEHVVWASELSVEQTAAAFETYRQRLASLKGDARWAYGFVFKNVGEAAGASIEHAHSQLVALPLVPATIAEELAGSLDYAERAGECVFCAILARERRAGARLVLDEPQFVAFCPFAARFPYETWILPTAHASHFEESPGASAAALARVVRRVLLALENALDRPAYNYIIHSAPFDSPPLAHYHWHVEILPRIGKIAGLEWGAGWWINSVSPEAAAATLRTAVRPVP